MKERGRNKEICKGNGNEGWKGGVKVGGRAEKGVSFREARMLVDYT